MDIYKILELYLAVVNGLPAMSLQQPEILGKTANKECKASILMDIRRVCSKMAHPCTTRKLRGPDG